MRDTGLRAGGFVRAEQGELGIAGRGEQAGDLVRVNGGVGEAVADDEEAQGFVGPALRGEMCSVVLPCSKTLPLASLTVMASG
jgi:hypothetical protein